MITSKNLTIIKHGTENLDAVIMALYQYYQSGKISHDEYHALFTLLVDTGNCFGLLERKLVEAERPRNDKVEGWNSHELWRTLIRVEHIYSDGDIMVIIPGWNPELPVTIKADVIPLSISEFLRKCDPLFVPIRVHAKVNIGCETKEQLVFKDWEVT